MLRGARAVHTPAVDLFAALVPLVTPFYFIWHWLSGDRYLLRYLGCRRAFRVGWLITAAAVLSSWVFFAVNGLRVGTNPAFWVWAVFVVAWMVLIAAGTPRYRVLRWLTRDDHPLRGLRRALWNIGLSLPYLEHPDRDPLWAKRAQVAIQWLGILRTPETAAIIDLWLAEVEAVRSGLSDPEAEAKRHEAIRAEAHRLWPDGDKSEIAALVG